MLPRLVRSYAVDVIERPTSQKLSGPGFRRPDRSSTVILKASFDDRPALGLGRDLGYAWPRTWWPVHLLVDEVVVHLAAFSGPRSTTSRTRFGPNDPRPTASPESTRPVRVPPANRSTSLAGSGLGEVVLATAEGEWKDSSRRRYSEGYQRGFRVAVGHSIPAIGNDSAAIF